MIGGEIKKRKNLIIEFLHNPTFRDCVFMTVSAILNLLHASVKLAIAVFEKSFWFGMIAVYFLCLWEIRSLIVWELERKPFDRKREYQFSVFCGIWFLVLNMVLSGITLQMIWFGRCYEYPQHLIVLVGVYIFYAIISGGTVMTIIESRKKALDTMEKLQQMGYVRYELDADTKKFTDWVRKCSETACMKGAVYTTEGYGFLCIPRNITERLAREHYIFDEADAWLELWCHTVTEDPNNVFSFVAPAVQYGKYGAVLTLEILGQRWGWEKTKLWQFFQKHGGTAYAPR